MNRRRKVRAAGALPWARRRLGRLASRALTFLFLLVALLLFAPTGSSPFIYLRF
jgi:hypothetical protein